MKKKNMRMSDYIDYYLKHNKLGEYDNEHHYMVGAVLFKYRTGEVKLDELKDAFDVLMLINKEHNNSIEPLNDSIIILSDAMVRIIMDDIII